MVAIPREFWDFLLSVDAPVERPQEFLRVCATAFMANSTSDAIDLVGFEVSDAKKGGSTHADSSGFRECLSCIP